LLFSAQPNQLFSEVKIMGAVQVGALVQGGFKTMLRILCPTDLSSHSKDSVAYALRIAKENEAQLTIFHVTSFPEFSQYPADELTAHYQWDRLISKFKMDQILGVAERQLRNFVGARLAVESKGVEWKARVALGRVAEEIVTAAIQENADLIVMARCKRGMLARILRSSIPEAVGKSAPCPVLSIDASRFVCPSQGWKVPMARELFQNS
jgi:nucleotide-binding universal stress UspA family protein